MQSPLPPPQPPPNARPDICHRQNCPTRRTYTIKEVAQMLGVCERTVKRRWQDGTFPRPIKGLGRVVRFAADAIDRLCRDGGL